MPALFVTEINRRGIRQGYWRWLVRMMKAHPEIDVAAANEHIADILWAMAEAVLGDGLDREKPLTPQQLKLLQHVDFKALKYRPSSKAIDPASDVEIGGGGHRSVGITRLEGAESGLSFERIFSQVIEPDSAALWRAINQNHIIEFVPALARTYTRAKFLIVFRDPRGTVASADALSPLPINEQGVAAVMLRWRNYVALTSKWLTLFGDKVKIVKYETLVKSPEQSMRDLCTFMELDYDPKMIDAGSFVADSQASAWEKTLGPDVVELIEFMCGHEMEMLGYSISTPMKQLMSPAATSLFQEGSGLDIEGLIREITRRLLLLDSESSVPPELVDELLIYPKVRYERNSLFAGSILGE